MVFDTSPKNDVRTAPKSDIKAIEFRNLGNQEYSKKYFDSFKTLRYYNMSIAYAESKEEAALGYANRSAAYFENQTYEECLQNIQWARDHNYPADKMSKLDEREAKCKKLLADQVIDPKKNPWKVFELSYPANKRIPFIADCVELKLKSIGRGLFATRDLKPGDVISNEESVVYFLRAESYYERCFNCYKTNALNLIPCDKSASIMFCSQECKKDTYRKSLDMKLIMCDDIKLLSELVAVFGNVEKFTKHAVNIGGLKTIFDYDLSNPEDPDYKKNLMTCLLSSAKKFNKLPHHYCSIDSNIKEYMPLLLADHLIDIFNTNSEMEPFLSNMHQAERDIEYSSTNPSDPSIPLFAGLINRGRAGNVFSVLPGNKIVIIVMKPIKKGREILFSNNNHFELLGYGNTFDYENLGIMNFEWEELDDYSEARKYLGKEWKYIKSGCKVPSIDCYPTEAIGVMREMATYCTFDLIN
jgi:tetratricopeptide (TPR) repeat protein